MSENRIPELTSYEEMADFWDIHSLADYWDQTEPVEIEVSDDLARRESWEKLEATLANGPAVEPDEHDRL